MPSQPPASLGLTVLLTLSLSGAGGAQPSAEQQAQALLADARRAYAEKNYPAAAARFRDYLTRFSSQPGVLAARYGLAVSLLEGGDRDADAALAKLAKLLPEKGFADHPYALYYAGLARRAQADRAADPAVSRQRLDEAAAHFHDASVAFLARAREAARPSDDLDWAARARCDQAEMMLRLGRAKEARDALWALLSEKTIQKSRYLSLIHYHLGFACFLLGDHFAAGRSLSRTSVLGDEVFGTHARYLLGRVHQLNTRQDEREEARQQYQAALREYEAARQRAQQQLHQPADAETKARRDRLAKDPPPDHIGWARFFLAVLQYEDGRFAEALEHFRVYVAQHPRGDFVAESRLRMGCCQVQLKQPAEALRTLTQRPLTEMTPAQAAQALHWMGRAHLAMADPKKPETYRAAVEGLKKAAEHPQARRGEVLADLVEAYQQARQYQEAAAACAALLREKLLPAREEELMAALAALQQLAGDPAASDRTCEEFLARFPDSPLAATLLFRQAENAALRALAAEKLSDPAERTREVARHNAEALRRFAVLVERYPDAPHAHLARLRLGTAYYHKGDLEKAQKAFEAIPAADRTGDLAAASYGLAKVYLRQLPARADDALSAGRMEEKLRAAAEALEAFLAATPEGAHTADALLQLGYCHARLAALQAQPEERQKALMAARAAYERLRDRHRGHPSYPQAVFERAKVLTSLRDVNRGINELRVFTSDATLSKSPVAPLALLYLATLQRQVNRPADAAVTLANCRKAYEAALLRDPAQAGLAARLQYHHAAALREAGKSAEAQALFEQVAKLGLPEGWDAGVRAGQCQVEMALKKIAEGKKSGRTPVVAEGEGQLRRAIASLAAHQETLASRKPATEEAQKTLAQARGRLLYETAWAWRAVAELELERARQKLQADRGKNAPEVDPLDVPRQQAEAQVRSAYLELIKSFPDLAIHANARLELAEVLAQRRDNDEAIQLLQGALEGEREPSPELTDRIKLRLAACLLDRGSRRDNEAGRKDVEAALEQLGPVTANAKSPVFAEALYREAECLIHLGKHDEAIKLLSRFRDQGPLQRVAGVSEWALLRLGWALAQKKQWGPSQQAYEQLLGRFGASPLRFEARFGVGWALQNQGRFDEAVSSFAQAASGAPAAWAARAQFQVGVCRMLQKRYKEASAAFLAVAAKPGQPDWSGRALLEAARALQEDRQREQAVQLLRRVLRDHAGTEHAELAQKRLKELGES